MNNEIVYGFTETPFGTIIVARTIVGICDVAFLSWNRAAVIKELATHWGTYTPTTQNNVMADTVRRVIFEGYDHPLTLDLQGTPFHKDGTLGEYHWGKTLKQQLLDWEKNA